MLPREIVDWGYGSLQMVKIHQKFDGFRQMELFSAKKLPATAAAMNWVLMPRPAPNCARITLVHSIRL